MIVWAFATLVSGIVTAMPLTVTFPPLLIPSLPIVALPEVTWACGFPSTETWRYESNDDSGSRW